MSTRSLIGYVTDSGKIKYVYCHFDGYPEYVGAVLKMHYDLAKTEKLVSMGGISVLGCDIGEKIEFNKPTEYVQVDGIDCAKQCLFYTRDRGEELDINHASSKLDFIYKGRKGVDFVYLLEDGKWLMNICGRGENALVKF